MSNAWNSFFIKWESSVFSRMVLKKSGYLQILCTGLMIKSCSKINWPPFLVFCCSACTCLLKTAQWCTHRSSKIKHASNLQHACTVSHSSESTTFFVLDPIYLTRSSFCHLRFHLPLDSLCSTLNILWTWGRSFWMHRRALWTFSPLLYPFR